VFGNVVNLARAIVVAEAEAEALRNAA
jgi:hypothetical protein